MSKELIAGITQVANDKGLDREVIFEAIEASLISAYKRNYGSVANVSAEVDRADGTMRVFAEREVVEDVITERTEITLDHARQAYPDAELGDVVKVETIPENFGRIAAQTAKQVILQRIREAERDTVYENFAHRVGEIINGQVRSVDAVSGAVSVLLDDKHEQLLMRDEQIPRERLRRGDYVKVFVVDVHKSTRGPVIKLSRTHRNLLRRMMEQEIPEVRDGVVEIKAIAREPGARSKAAVNATQPNVDAVGSCVGLRGMRIQNIVNELAGEKIDVVEWSPDLQTYISNALSPAKVNNVLLDDSGSIKTAIVIVPDRQLSLAIGKAGQNARLAAKLTGWRIDIKSESEALEEGLDRMTQAQLQTEPPAGNEDLLARVERLLQGEEDESQQVASASEDAFAAAAALLEQQDAQEPATADSFGTLPSLADALEVAQEEEKRLPSLPEFPSLDEPPATPVEEADEVALSTPVDAAAEETVDAEESEAADMMAVENLPDVITADMLRARMTQKKESGEAAAEMEIPAELLLGLETEGDEEDEDDWPEKAAPPAKAKKGKAAKKKRRRSQSDNDDEFSEFY